jgi:hypothetical protein
MPVVYQYQNIAVRNIKAIEKNGTWRDSASEPRDDAAFKLQETFGGEGVAVRTPRTSRGGQEASGLDAEESGEILASFAFLRMLLGSRRHLLLLVLQTRSLLYLEERARILSHPVKNEFRL